MGVCLVVLGSACIFGRSHGEKPHACEKCDSTFARKHDIQRHEKSVHAS